MNHHNYEIHQVNIKSAYLNGEFKDSEMIYMRIPPGITVTKTKGLSLCLLKPIYGLHQSGRLWYQKLWEILHDVLGMKRCEVDQALFYQIEGESVMIIVTHVDDLTLVGSTMKGIQKIKAGLHLHLIISDLGEINWIIGWAITQDHEARTLSISQTFYITASLQRYGFEDICTFSTSMDPYIKLSASQSPQTPEEFAASGKGGLALKLPRAAWVSQKTVKISKTQSALGSHRSKSTWNSIFKHSQSNFKALPKTPRYA